MFQFVIMDGLIRPVLSVDGRGATLMAKVQVGRREHESNAGQRPGPDWRPHPNGDPRKWIRHSPVIEDRSILSVDLKQSPSWPVGILEHGQTLEAVIRLLKPVVEKAIKNGGAQTRRSPPQLATSAIDRVIKNAGYAMPTNEELTQMVETIWSSSAPRRGDRDKTAAGRIIIPTKTEPKIDLENGAASAPPAAPLGTPFADPSLPNGLAALVGSDSLEPEQDQEVEAEPEPEPKPEQKSAPISETHQQLKPSVIPSGMFWSDSHGLLQDNDENRLADTASKNGWPYHLMTGATRRKTSPACGKTLAYMAKTPYDPERHAPKES